MSKYWTFKQVARLVTSGLWTVKRPRCWLSCYIWLSEPGSVVWLHTPSVWNCSWKKEELLYRFLHHIFLCFNLWHLYLFLWIRNFSSKILKEETTMQTHLNEGIQFKRIRYYRYWIWISNIYWSCFDQGRSLVNIVMNRRIS